MGSKTPASTNEEGNPQMEENAKSPELVEVGAAEKKPRQSVTSLTLGWIAERLRRAERLKKEISSGAYQVNSSAVAQAMLGSPKSD